MERSHQNRVTVSRHKSPLFQTPNPISTVQNEDQWVKNVLAKKSSRSDHGLISIKAEDQNCPGEKKFNNKDALFTDWNNNLPELQIQSPPFRLEINELKISLSNFRSIGPHTKRDRPFDEIWTVKRRKEISVFLLSNFKNSVALFFSL